MRNIVRLPRFMPGQVIDLSYKCMDLPSRLLIKSVFTREQDQQWMYECLIESTNKITVFEESFIKNSMTNKSAPVYNCAQIIKMYSEGWRFCGNYTEKEAYKISAKYATNRYIKNVVLRHALDSKGCLMNGKFGIWIRYNNIINDYGIVIENDGSDIVVIK